MKPDALLNRVRQAMKILYGKRLAKLILFGSYARGEASQDSDIDILIVLKGSYNRREEVERAGDITAELSLEFNQVISCFFLSEDRFLKGNTPLLNNIRRDGIDL